MFESSSLRAFEGEQPEQLTENLGLQPRKRLEDSKTRKLEDSKNWKASMAPMLIQLLRADVTSMRVDAIAAPSAPSLSKSGRAVVMTGGNLLARFVIEVPVPLASDPDADARLRDATTQVLARADELAVASIGLPVLGKRSLGFATDRCAHIMLRAAIDFRGRERSLQQVVFCLFSEEEHAIFASVLKELEH